MKIQKAILGNIISRGKIPQDFSPSFFGEHQKIAEEIEKGNFEYIYLSEKFGASLIAEMTLLGIDIYDIHQAMRLLKKNIAEEELSQAQKDNDRRKIKEAIRKIEECEQGGIEFISFTELIKDSYTELMNVKPEDIIDFGYNFINEKLTGIFPSDLAVIGGETGSGKTTFATNIIYKASRKHKCTVFALEDRLQDYGIKAMYFEINKIRGKKKKHWYLWNEYRKGLLNASPEFQEEIGEAYDNIKNDNVEFAKVEKQMDIDTLERLIEEKTKQGTKLFLVDHLHYFDLTKDPKISKADYIEKFMVRLKAVMNRTGARILLIVHYKKLDGKKPTLDSFKDSISIVQNASYVISLWRDRNNDLERYKTTFFIPKSRNPNGEGMIEVEFDPDTNDYKTDNKWGLNTMNYEI